MNPRAALSSVLPSSPVLNGYVVDYKFANNTLTLNCTYTANWNFPINTLEVQGSMGSLDFQIDNITYTTFDVIFNSESYAAALENIGGNLMFTSSNWGSWQTLIPKIPFYKIIITPKGNISINSYVNIQGEATQVVISVTTK